jgi:hypothetical protein
VVVGMGAGERGLGFSFCIHMYECWAVYRPSGRIELAQKSSCAPVGPPC